MKALLVLVTLVAFLSCADARRIRVRRDPRSDVDTKNADLLTATSVSFSDLRNGWFNNNLVQMAVMQAPNKPVKRIIGKYADVGIKQHCQNGNCQAWGADFPYNNGQDGEVYVYLNNPGQAGKETIDVEFRYYWASCTTKWSCMSHLLCKNVGVAATTPCELTSYMNAQRAPLFGSTPDLFNSAPNILKADAAKYVKKNEIRISKKGLIVVREYFDPRGNELIHTVRVIRGAYNPDAFIKANFGSDAAYTSPAVAKLLASKDAALTPQQIVDKFFTKENLDIARMQNSIVKKVIGAYDSAIYTKSCDAGVCTPWSDSSIKADDANKFGGQGTISLTCNIKAAPVCDVQFTMKGVYGWEYQAWAVCPKVGMNNKCDGYSGPSYFAYTVDSNGNKLWLRRDFVKTVKDIDTLVLSNNQVVSHMKWHGVNANNGNRLEFTDVITWSTPFSDFENVDTSRCLSKTNAAEILKVAASKKGLKNKIILQAGPLTDLVKNAPYKSVDEAVLKIKGIGPVNVAYVSFWYNFMC